MTAQGQKPKKQALSAGQDTNHCKHKSFDLVSELKKGGCNDITGEEQPMPPVPPLQDMTKGNHTQPTVDSCGDITGNPELLWRGGPKYAAHILRVYEVVTATVSMNFSVV